MTDPFSDTEEPFTIIIPANNEAAWITACLDALLDQTPDAGTMLVIVSANACRDDTVALAQSRSDAFTARGSRLAVIDNEIPGKPAALNRADALAPQGPRAYLDADVACAPTMIAALRHALTPGEARFATGRLTVAPARSTITRRYGRLWKSLPFNAPGAAPGAGLFAVNAAGRARWHTFPDLISDDSFVRLHFTPDERIEVAEPYLWPLPEGFANLVRVRRRQDAGLAELRQRKPELFRPEQETAAAPGLIFKLLLRQPLDLAVYMAVRIAAHLRPATGGFTRGR
ncbi:glycosyltransferase family 2 protein [Fuscovulum ytuae]|uniref:Glycosyltransferase family A protein n=1 Tax=Fuscovulum ytuae TaxID=3042299 RepID=A0ABY8Q4Y4_9RHOB|nr:glycosyltransferase family A protein [Fuscovulum sp. YMD61]WGV15938.1 glycosyltransferase family A protein [Fuscovulum sp. YMD61]